MAGQVATELPVSTVNSNKIMHGDDMDNPSESQIPMNNEGGLVQRGKRKTNPLVIKFSVDIACLVLVLVPWFLMDILLTPYERGFFCHDPSIYYPYKKSSLRFSTVVFVGLAAPIFTILIVEGLIVATNPAKRRQHAFLKLKVPAWVWECYHAIGVFGFGAGCSQLLTDIGKYSIGRLRPHFIDACKPDVLCTYDDHNKWEYITDFTCTNTNEDVVHDARLSFPSGHSSFSFYTMVFLIMYLQARMTWQGSRLLRPLLQVTAICLAWACALSRVSDYKHHFTDVLAGGILGTIVAITIVLYVSRLFQSNKLQDTPSTHKDIMGMA